MLIKKKSFDLIGLIKNLHVQRCEIAREKKKKTKNRLNNSLT